MELKFLFEMIRYSDQNFMYQWVSINDLLFFLYTCMRNPRLRTVYRQRKWPLPALLRKIMALGSKIMALGCQVFHYSVKCSNHGLRGFINAVHRRLATQTVTMLTSCWQVLSEVELRRIFDVCKRWANSSFACICKEKYRSIHEAIRAIRLLIVWKSSTYPTAFSHLQCANRPFWPLVSKYTIFRFSFPYKPTQKTLDFNWKTIVHLKNNNWLIFFFQTEEFEQNVNILKNLKISNSSKI